MLLFVLHGFMEKERDLACRKRPGGAFLGRGARAYRTALYLPRAAPYGVLLFCFAWILWKGSGIAWRDLPWKRPGGAFLGRGARAVRTALYGTKSSTLWGAALLFCMDLWKAAD